MNEYYYIIGLLSSNRMALGFENYFGNLTNMESLLYLQDTVLDAMGARNIKQI